MDKENSVKHFTELSEVELDKVVGGDWWSDFIKKFPTQNPKKLTISTQPKIG